MNPDAGPAGARLGEIAERHGLVARQVEQLERLLSVLAEDELAPSTVRVPARAVDAHVADSLCALELEPVRDLPPGALVADLGSGAGFPGLPLAIALPHVRMRLLESQERKCAYLRRAAATIGLEDTEIVCARAEEWAEGIGACSLTLARALAPQPVVLEYAAPLLATGGLLLDWRGERREREEREAASAAQELGLALEAIVRTDPFPEAREHHIHVFRKFATTPERFPRRPGIARKRPLGAV